MSTTMTIILSYFYVKTRGVSSQVVDKRDEGMTTDYGVNSLKLTLLKICCWKMCDTDNDSCLSFQIFQVFYCA